MEQEEAGCGEGKGGGSQLPAGPMLRILAAGAGATERKLRNQLGTHTHTSRNSIRTLGLGQQGHTGGFIHFGEGVGGWVPRGQALLLPWCGLG